jgi:hypothetical protein
MSKDEMPAGCHQAEYYLANHFHDPHRQRDVWRVYYEDGRVDAYDGAEWWTVCTFTPEQVARAKEAIRASGLMSASDVTAADVHDVASVTYLWRLDDDNGRVTNWAYPAKEHPIFQSLDQQLDALEAAAGAEWSEL